MIVLYGRSFCRIVIGLVFVLSAFNKVLDLPKFHQAILAFNIIPQSLTKLVALVLLVCEIAIVGQMIVGGTFIYVGFLLAIILLSGFCLALISVLTRELHVSCNCFGAAKNVVTVMDIWRNIGFIVCALGGYALFIWSRSDQENIGILDSILIGVTAIVFVILLINLSEINQIFKAD